MGEYIRATYWALRLGMSSVGFVFPIFLVVLGKAFGVGLQGSMSAYYHACPTEPCTTGTMRDWFVGMLFLLGAFLLIYRGFSTRENTVLNLAGVCALGTAIFPMEWQCAGACHTVTPHGIFAIGLFMCIAYVALFRSTDTLAFLQDPQKVAFYRRAYQILGGLMLFSPLLAFAFIGLFNQSNAFTYFLELSAIWVFAGYWSVKNLELIESKVEAGLAS